MDNDLLEAQQHFRDNEMSQGQFDRLLEIFQETRDILREELPFGEEFSLSELEQMGIPILPPYGRSK